MKFYLYTKRKEKLIQIVMREDGKREVLALVPYRGGRYSWEYAVQRERATNIMDFLEDTKRDSRRRMGEIAKRLSQPSPWINILEKNGP